MNWISQVLGFFVAFGPILMLFALWHLIWNDDSGSDGGGGGRPSWDPGPPPPTNGRDRVPVEERPVSEPVSDTWNVN